MAGRLITPNSDAMTSSGVRFGSIGSVPSSTSPTGAVGIAIPAKVQPAAASVGAVSAGGRPDIPTLKSALDKAGKLSKIYQINTPAAIKAEQVASGQLDVGNLAANQDALNAIKARAMSGDSSPWLQMQLQKQQLDELGQADKANQAALTGAATARSALAAKTGLGSGAAERIATNMGRNMNASKADIARQGEANRLGLGIANDQTNMGLLSTVPGMDLSFANQKVDMNKYNIDANMKAALANQAANLDTSKFNNQEQMMAEGANKAAALGSLNQDNSNKMGIYGTQMTGFAADKQGDAIANGGKKGFLGTGIGAK